MPGPPLGALVANHDHIAGLNTIIQDGLHGGLFGVEDASRAGDLAFLNTGDLGHGAFFRQVAAQDR